MCFKIFSSLHKPAGCRLTGFYLLASFLPLVACSQFQPTPKLEPLPPLASSTLGQIRAYQIVGDVEIFPKDGSCHHLARGECFSVGSRVKVMPGGSALVVFSNGTRIKIFENTDLKVSQFQQEKFDEDAKGTFLNLKTDPSRSETDIKLSCGSVICEVMKLGVEQGSKFTVETPLGNADVRDSIFAISIEATSSGQIGALEASCLAGTVDFSPGLYELNNLRTTIPDSVRDISLSGGGRAQITAAVDPTTGLITGCNLATWAVVDGFNADFDAFVKSVDPIRPVYGPTPNDVVPLLNGVPVDYSTPPSVSQKNRSGSIFLPTTALSKDTDCM